ncbi:MAG: hypothetical protein RBG13Loki_1287 [Promethearchaeota archaeon CR_4]|nr:MAG: hypothetical protein RBG13Loki_1287 [Candidatus Lokiarchaeota archaeon CR_4]
MHVAIYADPLESLPLEAELARTSKQHPVTLAPEEQFFALKSYVAGIAKVDVGRMFTLARDAGHQSVGLIPRMSKISPQTASPHTFSSCHSADMSNTIPFF